MTMQTENLALANALYLEARQIDLALSLLYSEGVIVQMVIGLTTPGPESRHQAVIDTRGWAYPPQMEDAIIQQLLDRRAAIDAQLRDLGVAGLGPPPDVGGATQ